MIPTKWIYSLIGLGALLVLVLGIIYTIHSKNTKIEELQSKVVTQSAKIDNLEKNAQIDQAIKSLDLKLGDSIKQSQVQNEKTYNGIEKKLNQNYSAQNLSEQKKSEILIDSIWEGYEATK